MTKEALRKVIDRAGLNQKQFAEKLKVHPITVMRWLQGSPPISAAWAALIHQTFPE